ncbi:hypothetical protein GLOIN_2v1471114 [Rhizophagus clarus]|uniref:Uncharacterized protein n=1 Tax=Rhizophagus clarus TaxID=94130 RepID=A0A8H3LWY2_9GLOM|nr:hypothetical protein GLOIN_2v1471114 [Rhizophagus clarus]
MVRNDGTPNKKKFLGIKNESSVQPGYICYGYEGPCYPVRNEWMFEKIAQLWDLEYYSIDRKNNIVFFIRISEYKAYESKSSGLLKPICDLPLKYIYRNNREDITVNFSDLDDNYINLDEDDFKILRKQKIDGQIFPDITERKFMKDDMKRRLAIKLEKQVKILKEGMRAFGKGPNTHFLDMVSGKKGRKPLANTSNLQKKIIEKSASPKSDSLVSSAPVAKK